MEYTYKTYRSHKRKELNCYRLIMVICFAVFLPIAFLARIGGWRWRPWSPGPGGYGSVFKEARQMSKTVASLAISV